MLESVIKHTEIDEERYNNIYDNSSILQLNVSEGISELETFDLLNKDLFYCLYLDSVVLEKEEEEYLSLNREIIKYLLNTDEYKDLKKECVNNTFCSAVAIELLGAKALLYLKELKDRGVEDEFIDNVNEFIKKTKKKKEVEEDLEFIKELLLEEDTKENRDILLDLQENYIRLKEEIEEKENIFDEIKIFAKLLTKALVATIPKIKSETKKVCDNLSTWNMNEGCIKTIPLGDALEVANRLMNNKYLNQFADLIGRFKKIAKLCRKVREKDGAAAIKTITVGNKLERVLPHEKMKLLKKETKKDFFRKYNQKELFEYELESNLVKNKGPMIVCLDVSGSMNKSKSKWSKTLAITLAQIANKDKRDYACIPFSNTALDPIFVNKEKLDINKLLDIGEIYIGGGTNFEEPLDKSLELINESNFKQADIVFLTDGEAYLSDRYYDNFIAIKKNKDFSVMSIYIDNANPTELLNKMSDEIITINDLLNDENLRDIFQKL